MLGRTAAVVLTVLAHAYPAAAEPNAPLAEALFRHGRQLLDEGKVAEACETFAASQRADPALGTLLNLASCHERQGRTATAWAEFSDAASEAGRAGDHTREGFATQHLAALEKALYRVSVEVPAPVPGLTVSLDGSPLARAAWSTPIPVDPGVRQIAATAPGHRSFQAQVEVPGQPGEQKVQVPALALEPAVLAVAAAPVPLRSPSRLPGYPIVGAGVLGAAVGAVFGVVAKNKLDQSRPLCPGNVCSQAGFRLNQDAGRAATASTISFTVALVAAAVGGVILYLGRGK